LACGWIARNGVDEAPKETQPNVKFYPQSQGDASGILRVAHNAPS